MAAPNVVVISRDTDFAQELAVQVREQLALECAFAPDELAAKAYGCPVVTLPPLPVRLREVLADIEAVMAKQTDGMALGSGYVLQLRQKLLVHGERNVALTDKEAQLLQTIAATGKAGVGKEQLLREVWGIEVPMDTHTLETHIYRLRGKCRELAGEELVEAMDGGYRIK